MGNIYDGDLNHRLFDIRTKDITIQKTGVMMIQGRAIPIHTEQDVVNVWKSISKEFNILSIPTCRDANVFENIHQIMIWVDVKLLCIDDPDDTITISMPCIVEASSYGALHAVAKAFTMTYKSILLKILGGTSEISEPDDDLSSNSRIPQRKRKNTKSVPSFDTEDDVKLRLS